MPGANDILNGNIQSEHGKGFARDVPFPISDNVTAYTLHVTGRDGLLPDLQAAGPAIENWFLEHPGQNHVTVIFNYGNGIQGEVEIYRQEEKPNA